MMNKNKLITAAMLSGLFVTPIAQATNGYFAHGYGTKEKGLAGAGAAYSQDALAAATNPAGMAFVGERMDIGMAVFNPSDRSYKVTGTPSAASFTNAFPGATNTSNNNYFLIPNFGYNFVLDSKSTAGISIYGNGGMDTEFPSKNTPFNAGLFGAGPVGISLAQLFFNGSYSYKLDSKRAVGASLIFAYQRFNSFGLEGFGGFSTAGTSIAGNVHSYSTGFGVKLGYQGELVDNLTLGISYASKIDMSEFDEYKGLFAEQGDFDIPSNYTVGLAYDMGKSGKLVLDMQKINYTDVASVSNPFSNIFACFGGDATSCVGGSNGPGFGWEDMTVIKLGYEMEVDGNTYRFGYSKGDQPIPTSEMLFNILAPAVVEQHFTFGMTMPMGKNQELNVAAMIAPANSVKGANPFDGGSAFGGSDIEIEMEQKEVQVGWAWKY